MMYEPEKSDSAVVAMKPANKAAQAAAEWAEPRAGTKGNMGQPHTRRTQCRGSVSQEKRNWGQSAIIASQFSGRLEEELYSNPLFLLKNDGKFSVF